MHRAYHSAALALGLIVVSACAACGVGRDAAEARIDALRAEIARVQQDQDKILERLGGLEARQGTTSPRAVGSASPAAPGDRPPLQVVVLRPEGADGAEPDADDAATDDAPRTTVRAEGDPSGRGRGKGGPSKADVDREYQQAIGLAKKKQHQKAVDALTGFLVRHPDHAHADHAIYWLGEAHLGVGDDAKAIEQFEAVLARFPDGNKAPDALLKLALTLRKKGDADAARAALERLRKKYPSSDAARRAPKE